MPSLLRSSVTRQMPGATASAGLRKGHRSAADADRAGVGHEVAAEHPGDLVLAGAEQAGEATISPALTGKPASAHAVAPGEPLACEEHRSGAPRRPALEDLGAAADHRLGEVGLGESASSVVATTRPLRSTVARSQRSRISRKRCET